MLKGRKMCKHTTGKRKKKTTKRNENIQRNTCENSTIIDLIVLNYSFCYTIMFK